ALARELVPAARVVALREALRAFGAGERGYVRTPGLLDLLWGARGEPGGAPGLVSFFERGLEALTEVRAGAGAAREEPAVAPSAAPDPAPPAPLDADALLAALLEGIAEEVARRPVPRAKVEVALGLA